MPERGITLLTGASGYVGGRTAAALLARGDRVLLVVRDPDAAAAAVGPLLASGADLHCADLRDDGALERLPREIAGAVTRVVHAAAVTRFNVDRATAIEANVRATQRVLEFAAASPRLESFALVSTLYATGLRSGTIVEELGPDDAGFANDYEWSKWEAERLAAQEFPQIPLRILRLSTVIADDASGTVTQQNAFHTTLRLVFYGLLSVLPGDPSTVLHLVSGRYATEAIVAGLDDPAAAGTYHVTGAPASAISLGDLLDIAWSRFEREDDFRRKGLLRPLFADSDSFDVLAHESEGFSPVMAQAMATMAPFARQLYVDKQVDVSRADSLIARRCDPDDSRGLAVAAVDHVVTTRWRRGARRAA